MLLAERLRSPEEKECVKNEIEAKLGVCVDIEETYYGEASEARLLLDQIRAKPEIAETQIALTRSLLRLLTLVLRCIKNEEPVLLIGGKYLWLSRPSKPGFLIVCYP